MKWGSLGVLWVLSLHTVPSALGQDRRYLDEALPGPTVEASNVASLSFEGLEIAPDLSAQVSPLPGGGWLVSSRVFDGSVAWFDVGGSFVKSVGRRGGGPGEFSGAVVCASGAEGVWIVDPGNNRLSFFDRNMTLTGERNFQGRVLSASSSLGGGSVLLSGFIARGSRTHSLARVSLESDRDVFGPPLENQGSVRTQARFVTQPSSSEVWAVSVSGGLIDIVNGKDLGSIENLRVPGDEYDAKAPERLNPFRERPVPQVTGLTSSQGIVWIVLAVADSNWSSDPVSAPEFSRVFDTRIIAIDSTKRTILATAVMDGLCSAVHGGQISCVNVVAERIDIIGLEISH